MMKLYKCDICGKIVAMVEESAPETVCCGQDMRELIPNTTDGKQEAHLPVYTIEGNTVTVKVGSKPHPMTAEHHIAWIAIETDQGKQCKSLKPSAEPEAKFALVPYEKVMSVYEYCTLHGLWKVATA